MDTTIKFTDKDKKQLIDQLLYFRVKIEISIKSLNLGVKDDYILFQKLSKEICIIEDFREYLKESTSLIALLDSDTIKVIKKYLVDEIGSVKNQIVDLKKQSINPSIIRGFQDHIHWLNAMNKCIELQIDSRLSKS